MQSKILRERRATIATSIQGLRRLVGAIATSGRMSKNDGTRW